MTESYYRDKLNDPLKLVGDELTWREERKTKLYNHDYNARKLVALKRYKVEITFCGTLYTIVEDQTDPTI